MKISVQPSALEDLRVGFEFYERQQSGLGGYFLDSLYSDIDSLLLYAGIHPRHLGKYRLLSDRFPYAVYYELRGELILVRAVLDLRRDPSWISKKMNKLK
ncbi:MAG: type II toxin-antitoxin system RelE/ParE family toxin [Verrucomicrobia bacterium]|nr:type II toxin-antitoxin system RelE/ParE family toxin [Verrucomicrobiota bacterium]